MKLSWLLNMKKGTISNLKESWPQMNNMDQCSTIDHSTKNTRWIYVSAKCHIKCDKVLRILGNRKMMMLLSAQGLQSKPPKGINPNHANKGVEVKHGGNHLITG